MVLEGLRHGDHPANFRDVAGSEWWGGAGLVAVGSGLMDGYPDRTFRGEAPAPCDELAAVIGRLLAMTSEHMPPTPPRNTSLIGP